MENKIVNRTWSDKLITGFNGIRFGCVEPIALKIARFRHEKEYSASADNPLISVFIPTYNRGELLMQRAVPSVLAQTYKNFELIILGDHCTDNTESLVLNIKDSRVRFFNLPTRGYRYPPTVENHWLAGAVVASNSALGFIRGKWISQLNDDDVWNPEYLEVALKFAKEGNYEFVSSAYTEERYGKREIIEGEPADSPYYNPGQLEPGKGPKVGGVCTWLYRSYLKFFKYNINCWRKSWNRVNDIDLNQRIFHAGVRMGYINKSLARHLPRPGEETVGFDAYKKFESGKIEFYKFNE